MWFCRCLITISICIFFFVFFFCFLALFSLPFFSLKKTILWGQEVVRPRWEHVCAFVRSLCVNVCEMQGYYRPSLIVLTQPPLYPPVNRVQRRTNSETSLLRLIQICISLLGFFSLSLILVGFNSRAKSCVCNRLFSFALLWVSIIPHRNLARNISVCGSKTDQMLRTCSLWWLSKKKMLFLI